MSFFLQLLVMLLFGSLAAGGGYALYLEVLRCIRAELAYQRRMDRITQAADDLDEIRSLLATADVPLRALAYLRYIRVEQRLREYCLSLEDCGLHSFEEMVLFADTQAAASAAGLNNLAKPEPTISHMMGTHMTPVTLLVSRLSQESSPVGESDDDIPPPENTQPTLFGSSSPAEPPPLPDLEEDLEIIIIDQQVEQEPSISEEVSRLFQGLHKSAAPALPTVSATTKQPGKTQERRARRLSKRQPPPTPPLPGVTAKIGTPA